MTNEKRFPLWAKIAVPAAAAILIGSGFVHVVRGSDVGFTICAKDGWALQHTFVNVDDYVGQSLLTMADKGAVVRALVSCDVLRTPAQVRADFESTLNAAVSVYGRVEKSQFDKIELHAADNGCTSIRSSIENVAAPAGTVIECGNFAKGTQWRLVERDGVLVAE